MTQNSLYHAPIEKRKTSLNRWIRSTLLLCGAFVLIFSQLGPLSTGDAWSARYAISTT